MLFSLGLTQPIAETKAYRGRRGEGKKRELAGLAGHERRSALKANELDTRKMLSPNPFAYSLD